ncbi:MAG: hypothetical protein II367_03915 [Treponema sp.]|nr:hypothetical protein [Treponema sp.]
MQSLINSTNLATVLGVSNATVRKWINCGKISPIKKDSLYSYFDPLVLPFPEFKEMNESSWEKEEQIKPARTYNSIELFAGGGGLALGLHEAGFNQILLNDLITMPAKLSVKISRMQMSSKVMFTKLISNLTAEK